MYRRVESEVSGAAAGLVMLALIAALVVIGIVLAAMVTELFRIFRARAFQPTGAAKVLWIGLILLLAIWLLAGMSAADPNLGAPASYLAAWAFLAFTLTAEVCDWSRTPPRAGEPLTQHRRAA